MKEEHLEKDQVQEVTLVDRIKENMDLVTLGLAAVFLGLVLGGVLFPRGEEVSGTIRKIEGARVRVQETLENSRFDLGQAIDGLEAAGGRVRSGWGKIAGTPPEAGEGFVYSAAMARDLRQGRADRIVYEAPEGLQAVADRGRITISWQEFAENNVEVSSWIIMRRRPGESAREVGRAKGEERSYEDTAVDAGVAYTYTVIGETADPALVAQGRQRTSPSKSITERGVADFKIEMVDADREGKEATFKVEKWARDAWFSKTFRVRPGQLIGAADDGDGVDYGTGRRLASLEARASSRTTPRREVVFDAEGRVKLESGIPVTEEVAVVDEFLLITGVLEGAGLPRREVSLEKR